MNLRLPLSAKIFAWFLMNLVLLAVGFYLLFRVQFGRGFDAFFSSVAGPRVQALALVVSAELQDQPKQQWSDVLKRLSAAYRVSISLYSNDGRLTAGDDLHLPPDVIELMRKAPAGREGHPRGAHHPPHFGPPEGPHPPPPPGPLESDPLADILGGPPPEVASEEPAEGTPRDFASFMATTSKPTAYWCGIRVPVERRGPPSPVTLVIRSDNLYGNGVFFDPKPWIFTAIGAIVLSLILWVPLVRSITRGLRRVTEATSRIAEGDFTVRVPDHRGDELGTLGGSVNRMAARLDGFVGGQKRFLGDIAHELCSPIARMQTALGIIEQVGAGAHEKNIDRINRELQHMSELVNELLSFSKANLHRDVALQIVHLKPLIARVIEREGASGADISITVPDDLGVLAEPELLARALGNVLRNALRYAGQDGPIRITARAETDEAVSITIRDHGPGVPEASLEKIFDAFYRPDAARTREAGGVGLGLAIVKTCVVACRGQVTARNAEGGGLELCFRLLRAE